MRRAGTGARATYATLESAHAPFVGLGVGKRERRGAVRFTSKLRKKLDLDQDENRSKFLALPRTLDGELTTERPFGVLVFMDPEVE